MVAEDCGPPNVYIVHNHGGEMKFNMNLTWGSTENIGYGYQDDKHLGF